MKRKVIALLVICVMVLSGCGKTTPEEKSEETVQDIQQKEIADDFEELMEGTRELYEKAAENKLLDSLEFQKQVIDYLGQNSCKYSNPIFSRTCWLRVFLKTTSA